MSTSLGPVHHWLYNKIGNQEKLTALLAEHAKNNGCISDTSVYTKELPALGSVIDESNIHGWLQEQISDAETRYAGLIAEAPSAMDDFKGLAFDFGRRNAADPKADTEGIYRHFEDFFINGMPCDRVNSVTERSEDTVSWEMSRDIHAQYWSGADAANYYSLRKAVMDGMLEGTEYTLSMSDACHYSIRKK